MGSVIDLPDPDDPIPPGDDPREAERERYASQVEDYFLRRSGSARLRPPKDWVLVSSWFDEGIPIALVLAGIADVFDRVAAEGRIEPITAISYCRHAVRKRWVDFQRAGSGTPAPAKRKKKGVPVSTADSAAGRFRETVERLREVSPVVATDLEALLPEIEAIEKDESIPLSDREGRMIELERRFVSHLLPRLDDDDRGGIEAEVAERLARLKVVPDAAELHRLTEIGHLRAVRHRFALPRFTVLPRE
jgi:hypothetical protein